MQCTAVSAWGPLKIWQQRKYDCQSYSSVGDYIRISYVWEMVASRQYNSMSSSGGCGGQKVSGGTSIGAQSAC